LLEVSSASVVAAPHAFFVAVRVVAAMMAVRWVQALKAWTYRQRSSARVNTADLRTGRLREQN